MRKTPKQAEPCSLAPGPRHRWLAWALMVWLPLAGAACSGFGQSRDSAADQASATEDEDYPNLSRVPGEQPRPTPESLRKELINGLVADHANARYSGEVLTAATAAVPPAAPPPAARPQVEVIWDTLRVLPENDSAADGKTADSAANSAADSDAGAAASDGAAGAPEATAVGAEEQIQINWETERVEPSGKVTLAGQAESEEELMLAPQPELVAVVYFPHDSDQVGKSDRELLEEVVALYKERGGRLRLVGHSSGQAGTDDEVAQRMVNLDLSLKRANAVATTLLDLGAEKDKLLIEAKADGKPAGDDANVGGESGGRKVEIFLEH
jgi:outer membrane protein OmpA-like peptidoglycan-associated protein